MFRVAGKLFTFQYVSINTKSMYSPFQFGKTFTFQYVSINTKRLQHLPWCHITLHSNMFLLIPKTNAEKMVAKYTLHSNMFLLIQADRIRIEALIKALHSNMFLLIRQRQTWKIC